MQSIAKRRMRLRPATDRIVKLLEFVFVGGEVEIHDQFYIVRYKERLIAFDLSGKFMSVDVPERTARRFGAQFRFELDELLIQLYALL